jgi:tetratricopeptide (TPR) repeat protein
MAGADIWLDQLDIPPGLRWDAEIEKALNESHCFLVILTPKAISSNNVLDEISYALEEGKKVIPILLSECNIPFRIKRLQYIDFTSNYEIAVERLMSALNLEKDISNTRPNISIPARSAEEPANNQHALEEEHSETADYEEISEEELYEIGNSIFSMEDKSERDNNLNELIKKYPENRVVLLFQCMIAHSDEDFVSAKKYYKALLKKFPDYEEALNNYGVLLGKGFDDYESAKNYFERVIELNPDNYEAHYLSCLFIQELSQGLQ